jgi:curli biogenesis system outer membrane secretion channel CsgG
LLAVAPTPPTVAVLYFDYDGKSEELSILQKGLAQMLISDLAGSNRYQVVERAKLESLMSEMKLQRTTPMDTSTRARLGKLLGARYLVLGSYFDLAGSLRVDTRVVEVETGKVIFSTGASAMPDSFLELEQKLSLRLRNELESSSEVKSAEPQKARPRGKRLEMKTALRISRALDAADKKDEAAAKKELLAVKAEQPDFPLATLDLAALIE